MYRKKRAHPASISDKAALKLDESTLKLKSAKLCAKLVALFKHESARDRCKAQLLSAGGMWGVKGKSNAHGPAYQLHGDPDKSDIFRQMSDLEKLLSINR